MTGNPVLPKDAIRHREWKIILVVATIMGIIFAPILGKDHVPLESKIEVNPAIEESIKQSDSFDTIDHTLYIINYKTSGPLLTDFYMGCGPRGGVALGDIDPRPNCIDIHYDGKAGVVDLAIPSDLVKGTETGSLGDVQYGFYKELPFQHLSLDDSYTVIRISLPAQEHHIQIIGHSGSGFGDLIFFSCYFGAGVFFAVIIVSWYIIKATEKIRQRFRPKPHKI